MDSTIFNRRTLLGSGALVGLGALLAACGQQANNEAAATASAAPSETASASAAASDAASASATPSRSSPAATRVAQRHPTVSIVKLMAMVPHRMFPSPVVSLLSILKMKRASVT